MGRFVFLLTILLMASSTLAETIRTQGTPNEVFRPISKAIIQRILDSGVTQVGEMDLGELLEDLDTVEWRTFDLGFLSGSGGKRQTSIYLVEQRMVVVNTLALQNLVETQVRLNSWALHEALGALGYDDENYQISTSLAFVAGDFTLSSLGQPNPAPNPSISNRADFVERTLSNVSRTNIERTYGREGGTTVVGGGGDAPILELKQRLMNRLSNWLDTHHPSLSNRKKQLAAQRLLELPINFTTDTNYSGSEFTVTNAGVVIQRTGSLSSAAMFKENYLDRLLGAVASILLR